MFETVQARLRARLTAGLARSGITLAWWVPMCTTALFTIVLAVAVGQRAGRPLVLLGLGFVLAMSSTLLFAVPGRIAPPWLKALGVLAGVGVLLWFPVVPDFAPIPLAVLVAELGAFAPTLLAFSGTALSVGLLGAAAATVGLVGFPVSRCRRRRLPGR
ncbi:hypothetical protein [Amycolatopsis sp. NPDC051903]|uniref:hypothetical protein n=1 Tax=Amycolatopsis sp. NPDC051903 TaxID=3363936 RepID=UPI0037A06C5B